MSCTRASVSLHSKYSPKVYNDYQVCILQLVIMLVVNPLFIESGSSTQGRTHV